MPAMGSEKQSSLGIVTPDVYLVNKQTFEIEKEKGLKGSKNNSTC